MISVTVSGWSTSYPCFQIPNVCSKYLLPMLSTYRLIPLYCVFLKRPTRRLQEYMEVRVSEIQKSETQTHLSSRG